MAEELVLPTNTASLHMRVYGEPITITYYGDVLGYSNNTVLVNQSPYANGAVHTDTFLELRKGESYDAGQWNLVFTGDETIILRHKVRSAEAKEETEPKQESEDRVPPRRTKTE